MNEEILQALDEEIAIRGLSVNTRNEYRYKAIILMNYFSPQALCEVTDTQLRSFLLYQKMS